ncbi:MAG TPA: O-antigen ligase family protein [Saprospiraceae bacterium]|nr:O-antigen ligase family protein [Saprospiraceae bacterium]
MNAAIQRILFHGKQAGLVLPALTGVMALSILGYFLLKEWAVLLFPFIVLAFIWGLQDFKRLYLLMWASIPFAVEVDLPGGLSTDFPAEPLMWLSCLLFAAYLLLYHTRINFKFIFHPVFVILAIHFFWIIFSSIISTEPLISAKYTIAKSWYLVCFILIPIVLFREMRDFRQWGLFVLIPLLTTIVIILYRHSQLGFTFETINNAVIPIYRNHVDYACCLGILLPFVWFLRKYFTHLSGKLLWIASIGLITIGIYFSYTRAAWLCIPVAVVVFWIIRLRLMRVVIPIALALVILFIARMSYDNTYLEYAPDFEKTITHKQFDDVLSATYRLEDISSVERIYRWVAGFYMIKEKPIAGFGPSSFYNAYHNYVDRHFTTYVSDNPEHSGMHNYYLMVAVEQGIIGLLIFLFLIIFVLVYGERLYHRLPAGPKKQLLIAAVVSFACNLFVLTLNDLVETDKVGSFFFFCIAIVILTGFERDLKQNDEPV